MAGQLRVDEITDEAGTGSPSFPQKITPSSLGTGTPDATNFLRGDGAWAAVSGTNVQTFNSSGTWTKPASGSMARIQVWGGGGSGGRITAGTGSGGGGGGYNEITVPLSTLASSVVVTIGSGGAGRSGTNGPGNVGGTSSFGAVCLAYGGGGGGDGSNSVGGGGGQLSAGATDSNVIAGGSSLNGRPIINSYLEFIQYSAQSLYHGSPGRGGEGQTSNFGDATYGGAGGGSNSATAAFRLGGLSVFGGNAGNGTNVAAANGNNGAQPAGGGGSCVSGTTGEGGAGRVIVTVW